jgi:hypothetical protein
MSPGMRRAVPAPVTSRYVVSSPLIDLLRFEPQ